MSAAVWTQSRIGAESGGVDPGVTVYELDSGILGPTVLIIGGIHGNEVGGIVAAGSIVESPLELVCGRLLVVPIAHEAAWVADLRESPVDGKNLARVFPGHEAGSPTEMVADLIATHLIAVADVLLDLHTSSPDTDMPLFAGCLDDGSEAATRAVELAVAFGAPTVWTHDALGPGRTLGVARDRGIPALYVESPAGGVLSNANLTAYCDGITRVLGALRVVEVEHQASPQNSVLWLHGDGDVDAFAHAEVNGAFVTDHQLLDSVRAGETIGQVVDEHGKVIQIVTATETGQIATIRRHSRVVPGTPLVGVVPHRAQVLGRDSDRIARSVVSSTSNPREGTAL